MLGARSAAGLFSVARLRSGREVGDDEEDDGMASGDLLGESDQVTHARRRLPALLDRSRSLTQGMARTHPARPARAFAAFRSAELAIDLTARLVVSTIQSGD